MKLFHAFQIRIFRTNARDADHIIPPYKERVLKAVEIPVLE
jgi:hypothetical protein